MDRYDDRTIYCRKLGHHVAFSYCRRAGSGMPCPGVMDCWFMTLPVGEYLREHYTAEQLGAVFAPPKPKVSQILDIVARARNGMAS